MACCKNFPPSLSSEKCVEEDQEEEWKHFNCPSDLSFTQHSTFGFEVIPSGTQLCRTSTPPDISHEVNVAKSLLQNASSKTGDNLFDHLADIIKRSVNDPCENLVDYFEEYSHNLREQKFKIKEPFKWILYEPPDVQKAKQISSMIKFTVNTDPGYDVCKDNQSESSAGDGDDVPCVVQRKLTLSENVPRLHLYWSLCGLNISMDESIQLSLAMQKIQYLPIIKHARFWGKIYGLKSPYYIVEARLTPEEIEVRLTAMKNEMIEKMQFFSGVDSDAERNPEVEQDAELIPGYSWRSHPDVILKNVKPETAAIPKPKPNDKFNVPPEPVGAGVNKPTYFVVNSLLDDWIELPIVTPNQVQISRKIKRVLTGELEADVLSFPKFPGKEKHLLRAVIARITAGTYIAPKNYYKLETMGKECPGEELEEDEFDEEKVNNDAPIIENTSYEPVPDSLSTSAGWVHVRPNILEQGRVTWFNVEKARKQLEKENQSSQEHFDEEAEDQIDEIEEEWEYDINAPEVGPRLFSNCSADRSTENVTAWSPRSSSAHNRISQLALMRCNTWPGSFAFAIEKYSDCIYLGWGCKYTARNSVEPTLPPVLDEYKPDELIEITDPTPAMELVYEMWLSNKDKKTQYHPEEEDEEEETDSCERIA